MKKVIRQVNDNFLLEKHIGSIKPGEIILDTNYVIEKYHIMRRKTGHEYPLIQEKKIKILCNRKIDVPSGARLIFEEDKIPMRRMPKLEIKINQGGTFKIIEVYIYSENYWILTENTTQMSCGYYHMHTFNIYEDGDWKEVKNTHEIRINERL